MTELRELQQAFVDWLLLNDNRISAQIVTTGKADTGTRLEIYASAYRLRLLEALQDSYPSLHTLLGDERFQRLGLDYIKDSPSEHFSIRYFGHHLAGFLKQSPSYSDNSMLAEMATFEWTLRNAFDAGDDPIVITKDVKAVPPAHWADMRIELHSSVQRLDMNWNVPQLWQAIDQEKAPIKPESVTPTINWLIWRKDLRTWFRSMDVDEAWLIDACLQNETFADMCAGLCEWVNEQSAAPRVVSFLTHWCEEGLISRIVH